MSDKNLLDILYRRISVSLSGKSAETSENAEFHELQSRHYKATLNELYEAIQKKIDIWFGWEITTKKKELGNVAIIKCNVRSYILGLFESKFSIWLTEETGKDGNPETIVNVKSSSDIPTPDFGENQRMIAMLLLALDEMFPVSTDPIAFNLNRSFSDSSQNNGNTNSGNDKVGYKNVVISSKTKSGASSGKKDSSEATKSRELKVKITPKPKQS